MRYAHKTRVATPLGLASEAALHGFVALNPNLCAFAAWREIFRLCDLHPRASSLGFDREVFAVVLPCFLERIKIEARCHSSLTSAHQESSRLFRPHSSRFHRLDLQMRWPLVYTAPNFLSLKVARTRRSIKRLRSSTRKR